MRRASCERFGFHCQHWDLPDEAHALMHAVIRRQEEVYEADMAAGHGFGKSSESSVRDDGPRIIELLAEEGFRVMAL